MLEIIEAKNVILDYVKPLDSEIVPIYEALGRVLVKDIPADADIPVSDNSAMDGFAVIAADIESASPESPVRLEVLETIQAGVLPRCAVTHGRASRIMTGAVIPEGADAVVMVEDTRMDGEAVLVMKPVTDGRTHIRRAGDDLKAGEIALRAGRILRPQDIGMLASTGHTRAPVSRRPVVGILTTGDEIIPPEQPLTPGKVRNSNGFALYAQCLEIRVEPRVLGVARDTVEDVSAMLEEAARSCDAIITTGGVSMGEFDVVRRVVEEQGRVFFWKVRMKPGKPVVFGEIHGVPVFGLPGNPVSAMVGMEMFVRPALLKMMGAAETERPRFHGRLEHDLRIRKGSRDHILRGVARMDGDGFVLSEAGPQGSHIMHGMVKANCMIYLPNFGKTTEKGETLEFFFIA